MVEPEPFVLLLCLLLFQACTITEGRSEQNEEQSDDSYLIGTGIYDITGPAANINLMGYAMPSQTAHGIHQRLRSRAYIVAKRPTTNGTAAETLAQERRERQQQDGFEEDDRGRSLLRWNWRHKSIGDATRETPTDASLANPEETVCFVSIDAGMGSDLVNMRVISRLEELLPVQGTSGKRLCHLENLSISGTHTHSGPAGFLQYALYQVTSYGFFEETMDAFVEGIAQSVKRAYDNLEAGSIHTSSGLLFESNINRSPSSYLLNPQSEREKYANEGDTDKTMLLLKFTSEGGTDLGALSWFAVHGTSMNSTNGLISGDNKGYASYLMEKHFNGNDTLPGKGKFVGAFASTNLGDISPNTKGPRCIDTGLPCDIKSSTCNGRNELCIAFGPGEDMFESTEIIGRNQYEKAVELYQNASERLAGDIKFRHSFIDMSNRTVVLDDGSTAQTCSAALGYAMAAGTTDGPGAFDFKQGSNSSSPFWNVVSGFISAPTEEQIECQAPKPILLSSGTTKRPYDWDPATIPVSVFRIGHLFILSVPAEFTTMAGRRLRKAVRDVLQQEGGLNDPLVTIAGLANSYTHYVTTMEEYAGQRYEAASTLYGPHTLQAYIQEFQRIVRDLLEDRPSASDAPPKDLSKKQISLLPPVELDTIGIGKKFGSMAIDAEEHYAIGDSVFVSFRSANPRNNQRIEDTFLSVDRLNEEDGTWTTKYVDGDWCTRFFWKGGFMHFGVSFAEITWDIQPETPPGVYRICHFGTRKTLIGDATSGFLASSDLMTGGFGSIASNVLLTAMKFGIGFSEFIRSRWHVLAGHRYKDFTGCSKQFTVNSCLPENPDCRGGGS